MAEVRPFAALRPSREFVKEIIAYPSESDRATLGSGICEKSLLHITRAELDFDPVAGMCEDRVYRQAADNFCTFQERKWMVQDAGPHHYIHSFTYDGGTRYGFVLCVNIEDCRGDVPVKDSLYVADRMKHRHIQNADIEPVVLSFDSVPALDGVIARVEALAPDYDFNGRDGVCHRFWTVRDKEMEDRITEAFADVPAFSVISGSGLLAAALRDCRRRHCAEGEGGKKEECNYLMALCFPGNNAPDGTDELITGGFTVRLLDDRKQI